MTDRIKAYRAEESLPLHFDAAKVVELARAAQFAVDAGELPPEAVTTLGGRYLQEGRDDAGVDLYNINDPAARGLFNKLKAAGFSEQAAKYAAAYKANLRLARIHKVSFDDAYNGGGTPGYSTQIKRQHEAAATDPRNEDFRALLRSATQSTVVAVATPPPTEPAPTPERTVLDHIKEFIGTIGTEATAVFGEEH